ncbi:MAG: class II aldolase/adducin family protein [Defluviitaleaceae bacterium]|nr:class II aldolase/adducin family protein [Defluviitaleaceae bacterium]
MKNAHPAEQLVAVMNRIYGGKLTTTSGGNLSVIDENGDIWITPSGVDKGALTPEDIIRVTPGGEIIGRHKPSIELPFHASVYKKRGARDAAAGAEQGIAPRGEGGRIPHCKNIRAILHAHPPKMCAFSVLRRLPMPNLTVSSREIFEKIAVAPYAIPGSAELGEIISDKFAEGAENKKAEIVVLENHGVVVAGEDLFDCFMRFEALEGAAELEILASKIGKISPLRDADFEKSKIVDVGDRNDFSAAEKSTDGSPEEAAIRREIIALTRRACKQGLFASTHGTFSAKLPCGGFIITPSELDRAYLTEGDLIKMRAKRALDAEDICRSRRIPSKPEAVSRSIKMPADATGLHAEIYKKHPEIRSIITAEPPHAMAFAITDATFDPRTIPESYIFLRNIKKVDSSAATAELSARTPVLICKNHQILATGTSPLHAFDRLEVCEATANSIIAAKGMGEIFHISDEEIKELDKAFNLK